MLIDATHEEETRVVVLRGNKVEDFDFESAARKQLKGNIYLAKVTRIEPSLQAAFVDYGGNRHGFLAFNEIHPDYYQIPLADREALFKEEEAELSGQEQQEDEVSNDAEDASADSSDSIDEDLEDAVTDDAATTIALDSENPDAVVLDHENSGEDLPDAEPEDDAAEVPEETRSSEAATDDEAAIESVRKRRSNLRRRYKIQEVIRPRQILLIQVVKEERGNKGAALTTYISMAGRYCVLMPNTARGGGISRKITQGKDRKRIKEIVEGFEVADGMGVIVRTAGADRTKAELKRDYEYLVRLWDDIRNTTMESIAPCLVHEEGDLITRSLRDIYSKDIDEILVEGDGGYRQAKDFMKMLTPSHAKKIQPYKDRVPLFQRYQIERQLDQMFDPNVSLPSGGYIVIDPTEALVSIDVNSGRSTRERNIEQTALRTNLEAAEEVARQLKLRDMAGLVVIDFIDMENRGNNRNVERKLKECLRTDRARIQIGRISSFGLLEMSRQRLRTGMLEASTLPCPHCHGTGAIRSIESAALHALRAVEDEGLRGRSNLLSLKLPAEVALFLLNQKRTVVADYEERFGFSLTIGIGPDLVAPDFVIERMRQEADGTKVKVEPDANEGAQKKSRGGSKAKKSSDDNKPQEEGRKRKRSRRRKPRNESEAAQEQAVDEDSATLADETEPEDAVSEDTVQESSDEPKKPRRRSRRGGRGRNAKARAKKDDNKAAPVESEPEASPETAVAPAETGTVPVDAAAAEVVAEPEPVSGPVSEPVSESVPELAAEIETEPEQASSATSEPESVTEEVVPEIAPAEEKGPPKEKRSGWWQKG